MLQYLRALLSSLLLHSFLIYFLFQWNSAPLAALKQERIPLIPRSEIQQFLSSKKKKAFPSSSTKTSEKPLPVTSQKKKKKSSSLKVTNKKKKPTQTSPPKKPLGKSLKKRKLPKKSPKSSAPLLSAEQQQLKKLLPPEIFSQLVTETSEIPEIIPDGKLLSLSQLLKETLHFKRKAPEFSPTAPIPSQVLDLVSELKALPRPESRFSFLDAEHLTPEEALLYHEKINRFLSEQWELPFELIAQDLSLLVLFQIEKSGKIIHSSLEKKSGNKQLDDSIKELLHSLKSLPALPESYPEPSYEFGIRFTPEYFRF